MSSAEDLGLAGQAAWLCQGGIFRDVPILDAAVNVRTGELQPRLESGPALLITHGCTLDKRRADKRPRIEDFHFLPLRALEAFPSDRQQLARTSAAKVAPAEVFYVGNVPGLAEVLVLLSEPFRLPAAYFQPELIQEPQWDSSDYRLRATVFDTRVATLTSERLALLNLKMNAFWTRTLPQQ